MNSTIEDFAAQLKSIGVERMTQGELVRALQNLVNSYQTEVKPQNPGKSIQAQIDDLKLQLYREEEKQRFRHLLAEGFFEREYYRFLEQIGKKVVVLHRYSDDPNFMATEYFLTDNGAPIPVSQNGYSVWGNLSQREINELVRSFGYDDNSFSALKKFIETIPELPQI